MKAAHVGLLSLVGMAAAFGSVFALTPEGGFAAAKEDRSVASTASGETDPEDSTIGGASSKDEASATFQAGKAVRVEGRLGHKTLRASNPEETFVLLEVRGDDKASGVQPKAALAIVIDKSGSMRGTRHQNALAAAASAVERLRDGDQLTVVAFDTRAEAVVPLTTLSASNRQQVLSSIRGITLGGDTCISCGIEEGLGQMRSTLGGAGIVPRMLVLSDGDTNNGIRDIPGFKSLAQRAMSQGVSISTIGVDVEYNEKIMSAIALGANGRHYFVENDRDLQRVFDAEAATLTETVASNVSAEIELEKGVELVRVFDRSFGRSGSRISIPLGALARGEVKTVLLKVKVPAQSEGPLPVAHVSVGFRDVASDKETSATGDLALEFVSDTSKLAEIDALVLDRLQRSETAVALKEANNLFSLGKVDEARRRLQTQQDALAQGRNKAKASAPSGRAGDIDKSFQSQEEEVGKSIQNFATPPPAAAGAAPTPVARPQKSQVKRNTEFSDNLMQ